MYFSAEKSTDSAFLASLDRSAKNNTIPMELSGVKTHWHACMTEKPIGQVIVDEAVVSTFFLKTVPDIPHLLFWESCSGL